MSHDKTNRYYKDLWKLDNKTNKEAWEHQVEVNVERRDYDERQADYVDLNNQNKWNHEYSMRAFNYGAQMEAHTRSLELADQGFDLNRRHGELAIAAQNRLSFERVKKLEFEMQASTIKYRVNTVKEQLARGSLQRTENATHAKHMIASQEALVKLIKKKGKAVGRGQAGRSALKESESIQAEYGRMEAARFDLVTRSKEEYQAKMFGSDFALQTLGMTRYYQKKAEALTYDSILDAHEKSTAEILLKKESADLQTESRKTLPPKLTPMGPRPTAAPRTTILDPPKPRKTPKPPKGDKEHGFAYGGSGGYAGSVAQGGFNAGSAMMTGGSLMASAGGAMAAGAFGSGAGITAFGAVLGPIGIGIAAVGFLGSVFDLW